MKSQAIVPLLIEQDHPEAAVRPPMGVRALFLLVALAIAIAANAPIASLAAKVMS